MKEKKDKKKQDFTILHNYGYDYKVSYEEMLNPNDYYIDFQLHGFSPHAVMKCESQALADTINSHYKMTEIHNRRSAKIVATDDPALNKEGVPFLYKYTNNL